MSQHKLYGLVGYPVKHSLSPLMHNAAFQALHIDAKYKLFEKSPSEIVGFIQSLYKENISGFNVTIPHKEVVKNYLDSVTEEANLIGAVNTVKVENTKTIGHNTDGLGFLKHLTEVYHNSLYGQNVSILGAGGAAKAVAYSLAAEQVNNIRIYDIQKDKAQGLAKKIALTFDTCEVAVVDSVDQLFDIAPDLLINATPIGMNSEDPLLIKENFLKPNIFVYDLVYNPGMTKLLVLAKSKGCNYSNGLGMLLNQGVLSFEFWTGQKAPVEIMRQALATELIR